MNLVEYVFNQFELGWYRFELSFDKLANYLYAPLEGRFIKNLPG